MTAIMTSTAHMSLPSARPYAFKFPLATTALIIIDMQRDFVEPGGFGSIQCGDPDIFASVHTIVPTVQKVLAVSRSIGLHIIHTREGHKPDLSDLPASKRLRQISAPHGHHTMGIGDEGPMGRLLVRGEYGHDIINELRPLPSEVVIDKPGKGSYWGTGLHRTLLARGITHLLFAGVTTECCVTTTLRECNDRGYECCILSDCTGGFDQQMVTTSMDTICGQDGLFGYIGHSSDFFAQVSQAEDLTPPTTPPAEDGSLLSIHDLHQRYAAGLADPVAVINAVFDRIEKYKQIDPAVWVSLESRETCLSAVHALLTKYNSKPLPPLFGVPFAVKDNIDVKGIVTTAGCEAYAYTASENSFAVDCLLEAGAIYIGKTNLDQLATGLSGVRSPYSTPHSVYSKDYISGGSSSGTGVAVGAGLVSFALGTDTAGSGRVPAALNGVVGFKPTKGTISARGVVPACRSLDTVSIMAPTLADARTAWYVLDKYDSQDPYSKLPSSLSTWKSDFRGPKEGGFTFGIPPPELISLCSKEYQKLFASSIQRLRSCGGKLVGINYTPFAEANELLYNASLVHERIACIGYEFLIKNMDALHPTTKALFSAAIDSKLEAWQVFADMALVAQYTMQARSQYEKMDVLFVPSVPHHPTIADMQADPLDLNSTMGTFTQFANIVDLCGVSVNAGWVSSGPGETKLPFGVTLLGASGYDGKILDIAAVFEAAVKEQSRS
ncbi:urea carboxylase [Phlyctema vagabunda]|uniref:Urea carboxylase n=1 Tax=Phlyctema vagabunda TaxID=108571 RepID=A0ABR4PAB9_9HELO